MRYDLALNTDGDLDIQDGDLVIGESDYIHVKHILESYPGDWKQYPELGIGIQKQINSPITRAFKRKAKIQLESDGYDINDIAIEFES